MTVSPAQLNFAPQKVGTKSPPQTVQITNRGNTVVDVSFAPFGKNKQGGILDVSIVGMGNPSLVYLQVLESSSVRRWEGT